MTKRVRTELPDGGYHIRYGNGEEYWYDRDGDYHRLDGPAVAFNGSTFYFRNGNFHRVDGPAATYHNGDIEYRVNGKVPKTILDIVIIREEMDYETFSSAERIFNFRDGDVVGNRAYRIHDPDELTLAILRYS